MFYRPPNSKAIFPERFPLSSRFKISSHSYNFQTFLLTFDIATFLKTDSDESNIFMLRSTEAGLVCNLLVALGVAA